MAYQSSGTASNMQSIMAYVCEEKCRFDNANDSLKPAKRIHLTREQIIKLRHELYDLRGYYYKEYSKEELETNELYVDGLLVVESEFGGHISD